MKTETHDILAEKRKHNAQVLAMISNYCRKQRMLEIDLRCLPPAVLDQIGNEIVDLFVDLVSQQKQKTPPETGANGGEGKAGIRGLSRG